MGGTIENNFKRIKARQLHPTFAAEIEGVDFKNLDDETVAEVKSAIEKVRVELPQSIQEQCVV